MTGIWTNDKGMTYMSFTIKDALELDCLRDCKLVAGAGGTGNPITCIDTMEIPEDVYKRQLPYSGAFLLGWIVMFTVWYLTGLPLGPGSPLFYGL